jgi:hypothetical protein
MAFLLCAITTAQTSAAWAVEARMRPMQFDLRREGPPDICNDHCRVLVSAVGTVTRDTPREFDSFARDHDVEGATLVLDSSGGSVLGTLALGRSIRRLGMTTTIGKMTRLPQSNSDDARASLSPRADCESMCAFIMLAGTKRFVPPEARVLVHEIWLGDRREDATASSYSAEDLVTVQRDIGRLAKYTVEMGGSIELLETALRIPPWEPMRKLSDSELRRMGFDMVATLPDPGSQAVAISPAAASAARVALPLLTERGWSVAEKSGLPTLTRRHTLTVEGEEIGSFDLVFACGKTADSYNVTYAERRSGADARTAPEPLKQVIISVGRKSVPLEIVTSEVRSKYQELDSVARGIASASLVKALADEGSHSLTVTTATANNVETVIRMGNTGVAENFPRVAASCSDQLAARHDTRAELLRHKADHTASVAQPQ